MFATPPPSAHVAPPAHMPQPGGALRQSPLLSMLQQLSGHMRAPKAGAPGGGLGVASRVPMAAPPPPGKPAAVTFQG